MAPSVPISIVLADDDDDLRAVVGSRLRAAGMTVWEADDGDRAVALVRERRPTVLVLDLWMPGLDGLQVLDALRFDPIAGRLAVVILTGDAEADGRLMALAGGAACFLLKGGSFDDLIEAVLRSADRALGPPFGDGPEPDPRDDPMAVAPFPDRAPHPSGPDLP